MEQGGQAARPRVSRKRKLLISGGLLVGVLVVVTIGSRLLFAPWSIGYFGRDTLTGDWVGSVQARQGAEYGLYLDLDYRDRPTGSGSSNSGRTMNLQGRAILCAPTGERYEYEMLGYADRSGDIEDLWLEYGDPSLSALNLHLSGEWESPTLALESNMNPFLPDGTFVPVRAISSDDPDDSFAPFTLTEGDEEELEAICQRIQR